MRWRSTGSSRPAISATTAGEPAQSDDRVGDVRRDLETADEPRGRRVDGQHDDAGDHHVDDRERQELRPAEPHAPGRTGSAAASSGRRPAPTS